MTSANKILAQVKTAKSRRHLRLLKGKFESLFRNHSEALQDSALRTFYRHAPNPSTLRY